MPTHIDHSTCTRVRVALTWAVEAGVVAGGCGPVMQARDRRGRQFHPPQRRLANTFLADLNAVLMPGMLRDHPLIAPGTSAQSAGPAGAARSRTRRPRYVVTFRIHVRGRFMSRARLAQRIRQEPVDETAGDTLALLDVEVIKVPGIISCARKRSVMCAYNSILGEANSHFPDLML